MTTKAKKKPEQCSKCGDPKHDGACRYNGWTNYETWAVALWIDNEEASYEYWRRVARTMLDDAEPRRSLSKLDVATYELAGALKREITDAAPEVDGLYADLLGAALSEVDWHEIAANMLEGLDG